MKAFEKIKISILMLTAAASSFAGVERDLQRMLGYTIIYTGTIQKYSDKGAAKYVLLDNNSIFKLDCLILAPLPMTDVVVFGKKYPAELLSRYPNLPANLQIQYKILIDREMCDATREG